MASARGIDPLFVYAIVKLESNFDPRAKRGEARGLLQIKPRAWKAVSSPPLCETAVWDWRSNLAVGMDGLAATKKALKEKGCFLIPVALALARHVGRITPRRTAST